MKGLHLILVVIFLIGLNDITIAQNTNKNDTDRYIYWTKDRVTTQQDYLGKGELIENAEKHCYDFGLCTKAEAIVLAALDIPKRRKNRGEMIEKIYFATVFDKTKSCILKYDTTGVKYQQVVFDIYELSARFARQQIAIVQDTSTTYGVMSSIFNSLIAKTDQMCADLINSYYQDVIIDKKKNAYNEWRIKIDKLLEESIKFVAKQEEYNRFIKNMPVDKEYVELKTRKDN